MTRNGEKQEMENYFKQRDPTVFNRNNAATVSSVFCGSIDEFKGEIKAWSQRGSAWVIQAVLEAFINVAQYQPFRGGCHKSYKTKKAIIIV